MSVPPGVKKKSSQPQGVAGAAVAILLDARSRFCLIFYKVKLVGAVDPAGA